LRVDSATIITDENAQVVAGIFQFNFDALRAGVANCIYQRFAADTVKISNIIAAEIIIIPTFIIRGE
jgi:hypothetical protein